MRRVYQSPQPPLSRVAVGCSAGGSPRTAVNPVRFLHHPAVPLLISGWYPRWRAALAATLAKMGRPVLGVDAPTEVADAFAAAWSQRAGTMVRGHRHCRVYRLAPVATGPDAGPGVAACRTRAAGAQAPGPRHRCPAPPAGSGSRPPRTRGCWPTGSSRSRPRRPSGSARRADLAADLISYGGAVFWEVPLRPAPFRDAAQYPAHPRSPVTRRALRRARPRAGGAGDPDPPGRRDRPDQHALHPAGPPPQRLLDRADAGRQPRRAPAGALRRARRPGQGQRGRDDHRQEPVGPLGRQAGLPVGQRARGAPLRPGDRPDAALQPSGAMPRLPTGPLPRLPRLRR